MYTKKLGSYNFLLHYSPVSLFEFSRKQTPKKEFHHKQFIWKTIPGKSGSNQGCEIRSPQRDYFQGSYYSEWLELNPARRSWEQYRTCCIVGVPVVAQWLTNPTRNSPTLVLIKLIRRFLKEQFLSRSHSRREIICQHIYPRLKFLYLVMTNRLWGMREVDVYCIYLLKCVKNDERNFRVSR